MRRRARERALQFLYQNDLNPADKLGEAMDHFFESQRLAALSESQSSPAGQQSTDAPPGREGAAADEAAMRLFSEKLIRGVLDNRTTIDAEIQKYAHNWDIRRMAAVDRNVLRMAVYELRNLADVPPVVTINEAVEIAKRFSTQDSGKFVNGILDKIRGDLLRPARSPIDS